MATEKGFTLLETLVALAIFASLISVLMLGYVQGLSMWERSQTQSEKWQKLELRYGLLSTLFAQAAVATVHEVDGIAVPYFEGAIDQMMLFSHAPILDAPGYARAVALRASSDEDGSLSLEYLQASRYVDPFQDAYWKSSAVNVTVLENLQNLTFRYEARAFPLPDELTNSLRSAEQVRYREQPEWLDTFNATAMWHTPQRVELSFTDGEGEDFVWTFQLPRESDAWSL